MRKFRNLAIGFALVTVLAGFSEFGPNQDVAEAAHRPAGTQQVVPRHDLSHPMKESYPCPGSPLSGVAMQGTTPGFACNHATGGTVQPYANNQAGYCQNGTTYLQTFTNVPGYSASTQVGTFWANNPAQSSYASVYDSNINADTWFLHTSYTANAANLQTMVEYFWCPAANSSQYPNGINYAYGVFQYKTGCGPVYLNEDVYIHNHNGVYHTDQETKNYSSICAGNYVWDYTTFGDGSDTWVATVSMPGGYPVGPNGALTTEINTPAFH